MQKRFSIFAGSFLLTICTCSTLFVSSAFADGNAGNDGGVSGSVVRCGKKNGKYFPESGINSCYGGAWVYYEIPDQPARYDSNGNQTQAWTNWYNTYNDITIEGSNSGSIQGGHIKGCATVGGYYRLAPFQYKDGGTVVEQVGLYQAYIFKNAGGWYNYNRHGYSGSRSWTTAKKHFDEAKKDPDFANKTDDTTGKNVSWFCYRKEDHQDHEGEMHSWTEVKVATDGYDFYEISEDDGYVGITLSTNEEKVDVYFGHTLYYEVTDDEGFTDNESAKFKAKYQVSGGDAGTSKSDWQADGTTDWDKEIDMNSNSEPKKKITVSLNPGETKTVCRKISDYYTNLTFEWDTSKNKYTVSYDNEEDSEACVTLTRPKQPGPPDGGNPNPAYVSGGSKTGIMFAGESSSIGWSATATGSNTRRLVAYNTISYLVNPFYTKSDNGFISGNEDYTGNDLCAFIGSQVGANTVGCATVKPTDKRSGNWDTNTKPTSKTHYAITQDGSGSQSIVVPEDYSSTVTSIGAKYCTTLGYKLEYWHAINTVSLQQVDEDDWTHDSAWDYWHIFDSACSVIAKRPQVAIWNGSTFSKSGIETAVSKRYANNAMGTILEPNDGNINTTYGSWTEYLGIANGSLEGLSSGAGLAIGRDNGIVAKDSLSNLTIANNTESLGNAMIEPNGAYQERLTKYLKDKAENGAGTELGSTTVGESKILKYDGDLTIKGNIINNGSYAHSSLKAGSLPQMVIFVDGNLKITKDVTQIDAWLIVSGNINTCSDFVPGGTQANGDCNQQLAFNGPVSSGSLSLNRTYGAESNSKSGPAEIFNLRPDAYIWAYNQSLNSDDDGGYDYKIVYSRELAPRY